ncbi:MAG: polysaccharide pyruvyl transferase family protein [Oxalobacter sp.]|nr:MAG: polysaccharide pyruvyl transferase family protein [Oxalobacter sp.]
MTTGSHTTILFGAFDRHNFGDMLLPHIVSAMLPDQLFVYAGLMEQDFHHYGGHIVSAISTLTKELEDRPVNLIHVGGELLTCDAWQAAVMLSPVEWVSEIIQSLDNREAEKIEWVRNELRTAALAPYTVPRQQFQNTARVIYNSVGGVDLNALSPAMRDEVLTKLRDADFVSVRDVHTHAALAAANVHASLLPDPVVMVAELFGEKIWQCTNAVEMDNILNTFPQGYLAVQFSADFGDDATLNEIASQLDRVASATGLGIVFFRAGAAPWHDDLDCYRRIKARLHSPSKAMFESLDLWDICALIAHATGYCGSSLHGRIVATAFALPHVNLIHPQYAKHHSKADAYANTWEPDASAVCDIHTIAPALTRALGSDTGKRLGTAQTLAARYRIGFAELAAILQR